MKTEQFVIFVIYSVYIIFTDAQNIVIEGANPREVNGGLNAIVKCKVVSGIAAGENPSLEWYDKSGTKIPNSGRVSVFTTLNTELSLMIQNVEEDDGGSYNCTGVINGQKESTRVVVVTKMPVVVTEEQAPRLQKFSNGSDAQVKCQPAGNVQVSWLNRNNDMISATDPRYVIKTGYLLIPKIQLTDDGRYTCQVVGSDNFVRVDINVVVTVPPKIIRPPTGQNVAVGYPARFECLATAKPEPMYQWFKDDSSIELAGSRYNITGSGNVLLINQVILDDRGSYKCRAFSEGKFDEEAALLRVLVPPTISRLDNTTGDEGAGATIKCRASGDPIPKIQWQKQGNDAAYSDGVQLDETSITVSEQRIDMDIEGRLDIVNLKSTHTGFYICRAINEARTVEQSAYLTVQYKPNFSNSKQDEIYSWSGKSTSITCVATSVPVSTITWKKNGVTLNDAVGFSAQSVTIGIDTTSTLSFKVDFSNEGTIFGIFSCEAVNNIGLNAKNFTLRKADPPPSPSAYVKEITPTSIKLDVTIPKSTPPVSQIKVTYGNDPIEQSVTQGQTAAEVYISSLLPSTTYNFRVAARSEVGESSEFVVLQITPAARKPYPVTVNSNPVSNYPLRYPVTWYTPNNGGYAITAINIRYAEVEVFPNKSASNQFQKKVQISGWYEVRQPIPSEATSFEITGLKPQSYYEVEVTASNTLGTSDPQPMIFLTSRGEPTTGEPVEEDVQDPSKKTQETKTTSTDNSVPLGLVIAIIIIVVIVVFIVIDVTCYYKRKCGVFMCIKEKVGRTGSMETRSKEKIIEEGDADGEKKVPLLADSKDTEGTDGEQEAGEAVPEGEKEPEEKDDKPTTPEPDKDVEEAEEVRQEDKPASPKEEVKAVTDEKKEDE